MPSMVKAHNNKATVLHSLKLKTYFFEVCELRFFKVDLVSDARCHERVFATGVPKYNNTHSVE
jgi:hypothetical protein